MKEITDYLLYFKKIIKILKPFYLEIVIEFEIFTMDYDKLVSITIKYLKDRCSLNDKGENPRKAESQWGILSMLYTNTHNFNSGSRIRTAWQKKLRQISHKSSRIIKNSKRKRKYHEMSRKRDI
jgi:hypothetical protein